MSDFVYRIRSDDISHASKYSIRSRVSTLKSRYHEDESKVDPIRKSSVSYSRARKNITNGIYKSKYYDPVARHERYMRERESLGIGKGLSVGGSGKGSGGSGKGSGGSGKGSGGSGGSGKGSGGLPSGIAEEIAKLRDESSLNTEAQREAARRKIEDLKNDLKRQIEILQKRREDSSEVNVSEIRGNIQTLRRQMERTGENLGDWISKEKEALERRIAKTYSDHGMTYDTSSKNDKAKALEARDKEVTRRADSIYKSKTKK